jgi:hypothetical protein
VRAGIAALVLGAVVLTAGCGAGEIAEKATGFHPQDIAHAFAPQMYCTKAEEELPDAKSLGNEEVDTIYRVTCLPNRVWGQKLLKECKSEPSSVGEKEYWLYEPKQEEGGFVNCDLLKREGYLP